MRETKNKNFPQIWEWDEEKKKEIEKKNLFLSKSKLIQRKIAPDWTLCSLWIEEKPLDGGNEWENFSENWEENDREKM